MGSNQINYEVDLIEVARRLKEAIDESGLKKSEVSELSGVAKSSISQYLHSVSAPSNISAARLGKLLHVNALWLMGFDFPKRYEKKTDTRQTYIDEYGDMRYKDSGFLVLEDIPCLEKTNDNIQPQRIPVLGNVAAGIPIEMIEDIIDYEDIPAEMAKDGTYFGLQIKGDSMEPRIYDGDVVIVKKQDYCDNNDIAIVTVNGYDATCKRILKSEGGITLMPLNTRHTPQMFTNEQIENIPVRIIGLVVEVRGKLKF